ncbi:hypothetical protein H3286_28950, partial [Escherichia coli]|nr:hypothetical protein [Escherichia coli]
AKKAGIKTLPMTGAHIEQASPIAKDSGILTEGHKAITGAELAEMSEADLEKNIRDYAVYARVNPEDKIRIV